MQRVGPWDRLFAWLEAEATELLLLRGTRTGGALSEFEQSERRRPRAAARENFPSGKLFVGQSPSAPTTKLFTICLFKCICLVKVKIIDFYQARWRRGLGVWRTHLVMTTFNFLKTCCRCLKSVGVTLACALALTATTFSPVIAKAEPAIDVLVYGGTPAGVMAAVAAAKLGKHVTIIEPGNQLGGMMSGGLGKTDKSRADLIGGYALQFFKAAGQHYGQKLAWDFEPHVALQIFNDMVADNGIDVVYNHPIAENDGVIKTGKHLDAIKTTSGATYVARTFIDASYEGDLMAAAGVDYTVGREARSQYNETLAGVQETTTSHQFKVDVPAYDQNQQLIDNISSLPKTAAGSADKLLQAYNFRLCMTKDQPGQLPITEPAHYDPDRYILLANTLNKMSAANLLTQPYVANIMRPVAIPNGKFDVNNHGPVSFNDIGANSDYVDAGYAQRQQIWQEHKDYQQGFVYFLLTDPRVPAKVQADISHWGLCGDEFTQSDGWPQQLYVREARRMIGRYVMTQQDVQNSALRWKSDSIGFGSHGIDIHNIQRVVNQDGNAENEGGIQAPARAYQIPYRSITPQASQVTNLLDPVTLSASHVAYGSLRMEPVYMITGQAAGTAASLALNQGRSVQNISVSQLQKNLFKAGAILWLP